MDKAAEEDFENFVIARSSELMRRAFVLVGGDKDSANDLLQAALMKLAAHWDRVNDPSAFCRTVMYRQQISWRRLGWHRRETPVGAISDGGAVSDRIVGDPSAISDTRMAVNDAMFRLSPKQRAVLYLRYFEDLPETEIAGILGWPVGTVRSTHHRALHQMRKVSPELSELQTNDERSPAVGRTLREAIQ